MSTRDEILAEAQAECEAVRDQGCELTAGGAACAEAINQLRLAVPQGIDREQTPHQDCAGRIIHVGDLVAFKHNFYHHKLTIGTVTRWTAHYLRIKVDSINDNSECRKAPLEVCIVK